MLKPELGMESSDLAGFVTFVTASNLWVGLV